MGSEWQEAQLTDLYDISSGLSKPAKEFGDGYPFLSFKDVFNNYFVPDELTQLVRSTEKEQKKCSVKRGDVFLTRTSETMNELGMSSVALKDYEMATFNGFTKRLRPKDCNGLVPEFVGYYLRSPQFRNKMLAFSTMSTRASLNNEMIGSLKISFPSTQEQKAIGLTLKKLDDRIDLNRRMNETLEAMAQALFKSWFVDFDPVIDNALASGKEVPEELAGRAVARAALGDKRKPLPAEIRALFPDEFVYSDEMGWIPKGWEVKSLDSIARYQNGLALQKFRPENEEYFLPVVKIAQLRAGKATVEEKASPNIDPACIIDNGDVIFSWSGSLMVDVWCGGEAALNQHLFKVTSFKYPKWFYYYWTKYHLLYFQRIASDKAVTMGHIKRGHLKEAFCAVPDIDLVGVDNIEKLLSKQIDLRLNSNFLSDLRDTLLPKLLSGELRIPDAEKLAAEVL
jgi:type I restriction enzyme, S subunit